MNVAFGRSAIRSGGAQHNEAYWDEAPRLERITFRFYPDDTTRSLALQNGEVDMITDVPRAIVSNLEELPGITIQRSPVGQTVLMYLARRDAVGSDKLLSDPLVRTAVAAAMDEESFVSGVLGGNGEVVDSLNPPAVLGQFASLVEGVEYDPQESGRLLDEAGWLRDGDGIRSRNGQPLELSIIFSARAIDLTIVEFVQAQLREVGIEGQIDQLDAGAYSDRFGSGDYDLNLFSPNQNDANPAFLMTQVWWSKSANPNADFLAPGPDTEFERLIDQTRVATDQTELQRLAAEAMHQLIDVEVGAIPLAGTQRIFAMTDDVQGFQPHPSGTNQRWSTVFMGE